MKSENTKEIKMNIQLNSLKAHVSKYINCTLNLLLQITKFMTDFMSVQSFHLNLNIKLRYFYIWHFHSLAALKRSVFVNRENLSHLGRAFHRSRQAFRENCKLLLYELFLVWSHHKVLQKMTKMNYTALKLFIEKMICGFE